MIVFNGIELIIYGLMIAIAVICFIIGMIQSFTSKTKNTFIKDEQTMSTIANLPTTVKRKGVDDE